MNYTRRDHLAACLLTSSFPSLLSHYSKFSFPSLPPLFCFSFLLSFSLSLFFVFCPHLFSHSAHTHTASDAVSPQPVFRKASRNGSTSTAPPAAALPPARHLASLAVMDAGDANFSDPPSQRQQPRVAAYRPLPLLSLTLYIAAVYCSTMTPDGAVLFKVCCNLSLDSLFCLQCSVCAVKGEENR